MRNQQSKGTRAILEGMNATEKLCSALLLGVSSIAWPSPAMSALIIACLCILSCAAGLGRGFVKLIVGFGVPITLMLLLIQGCYSPSNTITLLDLGFARLGLEGSLYAIKTVTTLLVFLGGLYLVQKTTIVGELVADLEERGLSPKAAYLVLASLNVVPQMRTKMDTIREAQVCRGLDTSGSLISRLKATVPLLGPVVLSSLVDAEQRSMTLELRGFGIEGRRTSYVEVRHGPFDQIVLTASCVFAAVSLVARFSTLL